MASPAHTTISRPKQTGTASPVQILSSTCSIRVSSPRRGCRPRLVAAQNFLAAPVALPAKYAGMSGCPTASAARSVLQAFRPEMWPTGTSFQPKKHDASARYLEVVVYFSQALGYPSSRCRMRLTAGVSPGVHLYKSTRAIIWLHDFYRRAKPKVFIWTK